METVEIAAELRAQTGRGPSKALRHSGRVPATFYGPKRTAVSIEVDAKEFQMKVASIEGSHLIRLISQSPELGDRMVLIREVQHHPVSGKVLHADFYEVDMTRKLLIKVPLHFVGKAVGVAQQGGILQPILREIEVSCLPTDIPEFFEVDVSALMIHDALHVSDVKAPPGVEIPYDSDITLVTVLAPTVEEVKVEAAAETAVEGAPAEGAPGDAAKAEGGKGAKAEGSKGGAA